MSLVECPNRRSRVLLIALMAAVSVVLIGCGHTTEKYLAKGEEYLTKRKFQDAMMQFRAAAEYDPSSAHAHWGLARSYENLGKFTEAFDELRRAVELDPDNLDAEARMGNYYLLVKPPLISEAEKVQQLIVAKDPKFVEGTILEASILSARGATEAEVVAKLEEAIAIDPKRAASYVSLSRYYVTHEVFDKAEAALKRGIEADPSSVTAITEYGRFLMYAKRDDEADAQFKKAIEIAPADIEAREAQAEFFVASGQTDRAEDAYKQLVAVQENSPESRIELAEFYSSVDRSDDAVKVLDQIVADSPEYVRARYALAEIYLDKKNSAAVDEQLDALFKLNDKDSEALLLRARARLMDGRPEESIKDLEEILKRTPSDRDGLYYISLAQIAAGHTDQANAFIADLQRYHPTYLKAGLVPIQSAFAAGDNNAALKAATDLYNNVNSATPSAENTVNALHDLQIRSLSARGLARLALGDAKNAQADLERVVVLSPRSPSALVNVAKVYRAINSTDDALAAYDKALGLDPQNFDAVSGIVTIDIQLKRTPDAHAAVQRMIDINAGRADVLAALHFLRSQVFAAEGNKAAAETEVTAAIGLDADYLPAYSSYASMLAERGETDAAIAQYGQILSRRPSATTYTLIGILEQGRNNFADAEKNYRLALDLEPEAPIASNNLAWLIVEQQGNLDEALRLATTASTRSPETAGYYDTLGWVYFKKNLYSSAAQQFRKAIEIAEKGGKTADPAYRVRLGMALASAGDKASARREAQVSLRNVDSLSEREIAQAREVLNAQ